MSAEDHINLHELFDPNNEDYPDTGDLITCERCGEEELFWEQAPDGEWYLVDIDDKPHVCNPINHWEDFA